MNISPIPLAVDLILQSDSSVFPELVWGAVSLWSVGCEESRAPSCRPWLPARLCILGSCGLRLMVWQSPPLPPISPVPCPSLLLNPTCIHHGHIITSWAAMHSLVHLGCRAWREVLDLNSVWSDGGWGVSFWPHAASVSCQLFNQ